MRNRVESFVWIMVIAMLMTGVTFARNERGNWDYTGKHNHEGNWYIKGTQVNATAAELNQLDTGAGSFDTVTEKTAGSGVTVDVKVLIKDGEVLSSGTIGTDIETGAPLAVQPENFYTIFDDFFSAGYTANQAPIGTNGLAVPGSKFSEYADRGSWLVTVVDGDSDQDESLTIADSGGAGAGGGWLIANATDAASDSLNVQMNGESIACVTNNDIWFWARYEVEDVSEDTTFVGCTVADTDIIGSNGDDFFGFMQVEGTNLFFVMAKNGAVTSNDVCAIADIDTDLGDSAVELAVHYDASASTAYVYADGTLSATYAATTNFPNDEALSPAFAIDSTDTGGDFIRIDYIKASAQR